MLSDAGASFSARTPAAAAIVAARPAGANRRPRAKARRQQLLPLQPIQRGVNGAGGDIAIQPCLHFFQDGAAVSLGLQPHDRDQYRLLERPQHVRHVDYIVGITNRLSR